MSARVLSPKHIATCAHIVRHTAYKYAPNPPSVIDIRMELAKENIASVAWRYGPEGQLAYAPIVGFINDSLLAKGWDQEQIAAPGLQMETEINRACFGDGDYTVPQYMMDCRSASPVTDYEDAEAYMYLRAYRYHACEHPEWKDTNAFGMVDHALNSLAYRIADTVLGGRRVADIEDERFMRSRSPKKDGADDHALEAAEIEDVPVSESPGPTM